MFSDNKLIHCPRQRWGISQINAPQSFSTIALEKGITWRDDREWLNGVPRDGEKNDGDHYMLMLGHTPYDDYAAFQHTLCDAFTRRKKKEKKKKTEIFRYRYDSPFRRTRASSPLGRNNFLRQAPFYNAHLASNKTRASRSLRYSGMKCDSYLSANEDKYFNWRGKDKICYSYN